MNSFIDALEQLKTLNQNDAFAQIFRFFQSISTMDRDTVIPAYQAFRVFCEKTGQNTAEGDMARVKKALVGRMVALCSEKEGGQRIALIKTFVRSTDVPGFCLRFNDDER